MRSVVLLMGLAYHKNEWWGGGELNHPRVCRARGPVRGDEGILVAERFLARRLWRVSATLHFGPDFTQHGRSQGEPTAINRLVPVTWRAF